GVRERGEAPPSRGKRAGGAPGPQGGGAEAPLSPAQRGDPGGRHGVPAVRDGAAPVSGVGRNGAPRSPGGPGPAFGSGRGVEGAGGVADAADLRAGGNRIQHQFPQAAGGNPVRQAGAARAEKDQDRSEEHTSELQSR